MLTMRPRSVTSCTSTMMMSSVFLPLGKPYKNPRSRPLVPLVSCRSNGRSSLSGIMVRLKTNSTQRSSPLVVSREVREGAIHLIVGPMFAGKTTALLERIKAAEKEGRKIALVKSYKDKRYAVDAVVSHNGVSMPCWAVPNLAEFKTKIGKEEYAELDIIGIDEGQFFGDLYEFCKIAADHERKTIIVASLDGDFMRRTFGSTLELVPIADSIIKLSSLCELCQRPASFTLRKTIDTETEVIGGADVYMPVCRQHYISGQQAVETAKSVLEIQTDTKVKHTEILR